MQKDKNSKELSQAQLVEQAVLEAENKDLLTLKVRKGDNFPLLSLWEAGERVYVVTSVMRGSIELARVMK